MRKLKKLFALCLAVIVAFQIALPAHAEGLFQIGGAAAGDPFDPRIFVSGDMGTADRWDDVADPNSIRPFDVQDVPRVTLNSISDQLIGSYVTVRGTSSAPCYRMAAKYVHNGTTAWLGDVYSSSYSKQFKPTSEGTYTVTLYSRSHPEENPRSASGSASTTFRIYHAPYSPNVKINNGNTANLYVGDRITVTATTAGQSYRMSAKYSCNGGTAHWLADISQTSSYSSSFTASEAGTYTVTVYSRNYAESDPHSASTGRSVTFTVQSIPQKELNVPLYTQEEDNTCGPASARMILASYGIYRPEEEIKNAIREIDNNFTYVYANTEAINQYLSDYNISARYQSSDMFGYSEDEFYNAIVANIRNSHPVQIPLKITDSSHFGYTSGGHYVVVRGFYGKELTVNDPHYSYSQTISVPVKVLFSYAKAHSGLVICVES